MNLHKQIQSTWQTVTKNLVWIHLPFKHQLRLPACYRTEFGKMLRKICLFSNVQFTFLAGILIPPSGVWFVMNLRNMHTHTHTHTHTRTQSAMRTNVHTHSRLRSHSHAKSYLHIHKVVVWRNADVKNFCKTLIWSFCGVLIKYYSVLVLAFCC